MHKDEDQANGQAKSSNKTLIKLVKRKLEDRPRNWHEALSNTLWAYRVSQHGMTKVSPYQLVYGHESVLPIEIHLGSTRTLQQDGLSAEDYQGGMMDSLDEVTELRPRAMQEIEKNKLRVARAYNKKLVPKSFAIGDLVWKTILPIGTKDNRFGKWSPTWDGLYRVIQVTSGNSYILDSKR